MTPDFEHAVTVATKSLKTCKLFNDSTDALDRLLRLDLRHAIDELVGNAFFPLDTVSSQLRYAVEGLCGRCSETTDIDVDNTSSNSFLQPGFMGSIIAVLDHVDLERRFAAKNVGVALLHGVASQIASYDIFYFVRRTPKAGK